MDILAFSSRDDAAAADQDSGNRTLHAAEQAADDGADGRTRADAASLALDAFALQGLGDIGACVVGASVDAETIEFHRQAAFTIRAAGAVDGGDPPRQQRACRHDQLVAAVKVDQRRRLNAVLDLRRVRGQPGLEADIDFGSARNLETSSYRTDSIVWRISAAAAVAIICAVVAGAAVHEAIEVIAEPLAFGARDGFTATLLHAQISELVA